MTSQQITEEDINLIRSSWNAAVMKSSDVATIFYNRLFYINPKLRPLFKKDIRTQAREFLEYLEFVINNLDTWHKIHADVVELGKKHVQFKVNMQDFEVGREALLYTFEKILTDQWTPSTKHAWNKAYSLIVTTMAQARNSG